ncbi:MAG: hypothetical protein WCS85_05165 [Candidatus Peribacteraceae bacterium]
MSFPSRLRRPFLALLLASCLPLLLVSCGAPQQWDPTGGLTPAQKPGTSTGRTIPGLRPCGANPDLFPQNYEDPEAKAWDQQVTQRITLAIEMTYQKQKSPSCDDDGKAVPLVQTIAKSLPQWKDLNRTPTAADTGDVLLDYLDAYGCALKAKSATTIVNDLQVRANQLEDPLTYPEAVEKALEWRKEVEERLGEEREALRRTLFLLQGGSRISPLEHSLVCLTRASKDLRNVLGLLAEAATCIPTRTWDVQGWLRFIPNS